MVTVNGEPKGSIATYKSGELISTRPRTRIELGKLNAGEVLEISIQLNLNYRDFYKGNRFIKYNGDEGYTYTLSTAMLCLVDDEAEAYYIDVKNALDAYNVIKNKSGDIIDRISHINLGRGLEEIIRSMSRDNDLVNDMFDAIQASLNCLPFYVQFLHVLVPCFQHTV